MNSLPSSQCYERNIHALTEAQPELAANVESARIPDGVTEAVGRDGSHKLRICGADGRSAWFGRSSMPTISAEAVLGGVGANGGQVTIPGVLTGLEPLLLVRRMPPHQAVFVAERNLVNIKLACRLYDYADAIACGRLIFIDGDNVGSELRRFFQQRPGYEFPTRLISAPQCTATQFVELQRMLETAGDEVGKMRVRQVDTLLGRLRDRAVRGVPDRPRIAVVGSDVSPLSNAQADRIERALRALDWPYEMCIPNAPDRCHLAARLAAIDRVQADFVLLLNGCTGLPFALLPQSLPVASWYLPGTPLGLRMPEELRPVDAIFASSIPLFESLGGEAAGSALRLLEVSADHTANCGDARSPSATKREQDDVAVVADLPDDRPEAAGINLKSQLTLWHALQQVARQHGDDYNEETAEGLFEIAEHASGIRMKDAGLRDQFLAQFKTRIAPAVIARGGVEALDDTGCKVGVWGHNWNVSDEGNVFCRGAIVAGDISPCVSRGVGIVIFPLATAESVQNALDAMLVGAVVVCYTPDEPIDATYPILADIASCIFQYRTQGELTAAVEAARKLRTDDTAIATARSLLAEHHTIAARLRTMRDAVRVRQDRLAHRVP